MDWLALISVVSAIVVPTLYGIHKLVNANDDIRA